MTSNSTDSLTPDFFRPRLDAGVAVGCRFHDISRLDFLTRAVNSILAMSDVDVRCIVACQNFDDEQLDAVTSAIRPYETIHNASVEVLNISLPDDSDGRAALLNRIIDRVEDHHDSEFLMFVDYDDVVFAHAAIVLVNSILYSQCDLAYAKVLDADEVLTPRTRFTRQLCDLHSIDRKYRPDLFHNNFLPLHSYMFRLSSLLESGLRYDEQLCRLEDYDLLLRFLRDRPASPLAQEILIGLYNFHYHGQANINTTNNPFTPGGWHDEIWEEASLIVRNKMAQLPVLTFASDYPLGTR